ncbi:hypothetical protein GCM10010171_55890 [Actinokineospora fastidiosa]|uniref:Uncharacterized protein n=1 Tax=Actinokineospora fastidiosa TaxID=1816 RepID=A0A918GQ88_9PSEU|nr:hypothetical protein GCM10010171_55890 [Actinokineospora fastidiosa]
MTGGSAAARTTPAARHAHDSTHAQPGAAKVPLAALAGGAKTPTDGMVGRAKSPTDALACRAKTPTDGLAGRARNPKLAARAKPLSGGGAKAAAGDPADAMKVAASGLPGRVKVPSGVPGGWAKAASRLDGRRKRLRWEVRPRGGHTTRRGLRAPLPPNTPGGVR